MPRVPVRCLLLALAALAAPNRAHAGGDDPLAALSGQAALEIAKALSTDAMKGRKTGFEGGKKAADYVAQAMGEMGLDPKDPNGTYLDPFGITVTQVKAPISLAVGDQPLVYGTDYLEIPGTRAGKIEAEVVFVGFGISAAGFDEYAGADVRGKVVLALHGTPRERADLAGDWTAGGKCLAAKDLGAKAFLLCGGERPPFDVIDASMSHDLPALALAAKAADRILAAAKTSSGGEQSARDTSKTALKPFATGSKVALDVRVELDGRARGHNALGAIRGRDPDLRREVVLVGANMDGLGVDAEGRVYNGADDNASGAAVLLHVARTLLEANWKPKRMVLFVAFGAKRQGNLGSWHLAEGLPFEHDGVVCVINVDRVGRGNPEVALTIRERFAAMGERLHSYLPEPLRKFATWGRAPDLEGDHVSFAEKGIPALLLSTRGEHPSAYALDDDAEHLKPECLEAAAKVLGALVVRLGEEPEPLKAKAKPAEAPR